MQTWYYPAIVICGMLAKQRRTTQEMESEVKQFLEMVSLDSPAKQNREIGNAESEIVMPLKSSVC